MSIRLVESEADLEKVKELFREYFAWLDHNLQVDMTYQDIENELATLPGVYAPPEGCLILAEVEGQAVGCVALRPRQPGICEMKRMYVRPACQGLGLGRALCRQVIAEGLARGYQIMRLDTEISLRAAQAIYLSEGFEVVPPYYEVPPEILPRTIFMERKLR